VPANKINNKEPYITSLTYTMEKLRHRGYQSSHLLDIGTVTTVVATNIALATGVTPAASATFNSNRFFGSGKKRRTDSFIAVDANQMAAKIVFATERASTRSLRTYVGLEPVWVVGCHVRL
jgi:hypothetical protein